MCLFACRKATKEKYDEWIRKKRTFIWAWKIVMVECRKMRSLYWSGHIWRPGVNKSNARSKPYYSGKKVLAHIDNGMHVYLQKPSSYYIDGGKQIIKVKCYLDKLVAVDKHVEAVFLEVYLPQSEYKRVCTV